MEGCIISFVWIHQLPRIRDMIGKGVSTIGGEIVNGGSKPVADSKSSKPAVI